MNIKKIIANIIYWGSKWTINIVTAIAIIFASFGLLIEVGHIPFKNLIFYFFQIILGAILFFVVILIYLWAEDNK